MTEVVKKNIENRRRYILGSKRTITVNNFAGKESQDLDLKFAMRVVQLLVLLLLVLFFATYS